MGVRKFRCDEQSKFGIESDHLIVKLDHHLITCVAYMNIDVITFTHTYVHAHRFTFYGWYLETAEWFCIPCVPERNWNKAA